MSSLTTPTAASFPANDSNNNNNNNNNNSNSISTNTTSNVISNTNNSNNNNANLHRPITPSESSSCHSIRSNQAVSALSPASSVGSIATNSSESVRFSPFPSPNQARLRRGGHGVEDVEPLDHGEEQTTDHLLPQSQPHSQLRTTSPKPSSTLPPAVSPGTKVSQFQLQPPKTEFRPSMMSNSFPSMPSLSASDSATSTQSWPDGQTPNVYINGLPAHFPEDQLYALTAVYGPVKSVRSFTRHVADRASGYGFVLFEAMEDAQRCIDNLKQYKHLHPSFSKQVHKIPGTPYFHMAGNNPGGQQAEGTQDASAEESFKAKMGKLADTSSTNLYIEGLPLSVDDASLANLIAPYAIKSSRMFQTKLSDPPRVIAFVRLESREAAEEIIERLHGRMVRGVNDVGSRISVRFADSGDQRDLRRVERSARNEDISPNRLTIAQAALLNLHGQDATIKPRVRRHPAPVTSANLHFPMPTSSSLPVIGTRRAESLTPIAHSVSLPGMPVISLSPLNQHSSLPVIGTHTPPLMGGRQGDRSHNHGSTLPVHPQIDAFNSTMSAVANAAHQPQILSPSSSSQQFDAHPQDVLDLGGGVSQTRGCPPLATSDETHWLRLNALKKQQQILHGNANGGGQVKQPFWDEQIQALRRTGVPFDGQQDHGDGEQGSPIVLGGAGRAGNSVRARNGYTPAEEAILRAHSAKMRGQGTVLGQGQGQGHAQFNPVHRGVVQSHGQTFRPARIVNPFAAEEQQFHEQHSQQLGNQQQHDSRLSHGAAILHANGQFSRVGQLPASARASQSSVSTSTAGMHYQKVQDHGQSPVLPQQKTSFQMQQDKATSYRPHLRASTQPAQRSLPGGMKHAPTNSLSVSIRSGEGRSAALPIVAPPAPIREEGGGSSPSVTSSLAGMTLSSNTGSTTETSSSPALNINTQASSIGATSPLPDSRLEQNTSSAAASSVHSPQVQASASFGDSPQVQASASYSDSPLNSPALTYSSSTASLSPATPFFGSFANSGEMFGGNEQSGKVGNGTTTEGQAGKGQSEYARVMQGGGEEQLVGETGRD